MDSDIKALVLEDFAYLMLATLADNSKLTDSCDKNIKIVSLPVCYKQIIENILCADNDWKDKFSVLIDISEYFEDHFMWEMELSFRIKDILKYLNKKVEYDFVTDKILIPFSKDEINMIFSRYHDIELKKVMVHFTDLLVDFIYTRKFQERFCDYSAKAVKKMHDINYGSVMDNEIKKEKNIFKLIRRK